MVRRACHPLGWSIVVCWIAVAGLARAEEGPPVGLELRYTGSVTPLGDQDAAGKRFAAVFFVVGRSQAGSITVGYLVEERGRGQWPWPEAFGQIEMNPRYEPTDAASGPAVLYELQNQFYPLRLPLPWFPYADRLQAGNRFQVDHMRYEVTAQQEVRGRLCWQVEVLDNFGVGRVLWVEVKSPLIVGADERTFMGEGEEFHLSVRLEEVRPLSEAQLASQRKPLEMLLDLKKQMQWKAGTTSDVLSFSQLEHASMVVEDVQKAAAATPFERLVAEIDRDVLRQLHREGNISKLVAEQTGKAAPTFQLATLDGQEFSSEDLESHITVLHFWDYRGEPLVEPYGQVGYLDFLFGQRRGQRVEVYGVAVDRRLGDRETEREPLRQIRKLRQFMNLSYPIALDDGRMLRAFGDPQRFGAELPLYVVIDPNGKIAHYHVGCYQINPDDGLRPLDEAIDALRNPKPESP